MAEETKVQWQVERRLEFIEFRLAWEGGVRRSDLMNMFKVSRPQASKDLSLYKARAPSNAVYDERLKRYVAGDQFRPVLLKGGPDPYLKRLRSLGEGLTEPSESWIGVRPEVDSVLTPTRQVSDECLRPILASYRLGGSIEIHYQSMSCDRAEPVWQRITPHAFGHDGLQWHARAYCHLTNQFRDFLLCRIIGVRNLGEGGRSGSDDWQWQERFSVIIAPHPELTPEQRRMVELDYGMVDGTTALEVRYAMLFYTLKKLNLLGEPEKLSPRTQHIVLVNRSETRAALEKAAVAL